MKRRVQFIYAKDTAEIFNRQSALGSYIYCLASLLRSNGYEIRLNEIAFDESRKQQNISLARNQGSSSFLKKMIPSFIKEAIKDFRLFRRMKDLYEQVDKGNKFDVILEFYTYGSDLGYRLSKRYNIPLVLVYDNPVLEEHSFFNKGQLFFKGKIELREKNSILQSRSVIVYSNAVKKHLEKKFNTALPAFIHQNVDYTRFEFINEKSAHSEINIGFVGSFLKWHRVDLLLRAFIKLKDEGHNVKLFLLGNGMDYSRIKKLAEECKYSNCIEMPGFMDGEGLLNYKKRFDIGVMSGSNWYGAPNKIFEYGAAGMAVVAPDTPTIIDLFEPNKELLAFENNNGDDLYRKIKMYIENRTLMEEHSRLLKEKIKRNYSEKITFVFYDQLLS